MIAAVLLVASCSTSTDAADPTGTSVPGAGTPLTTRALETTDDCTAPPTSTSSTTSIDRLDERQLSRSSDEVRLPPELGVPVSIASHADGLVLLASMTESSLPAAGGGSAALDYTRSDLLVHRLDASGSLVWSVHLGTFVEWYLIASNQLLAVDGESIHVLWPRFDGSLPASLYGPAPATLVMSTIGTDGTKADEVLIGQLDPPSHPPTFGVPWLLALGGEGRSTVGALNADLLTVSTFDAKGSLRWTDTLSTTDDGPPLLAVEADDVVGAGGGTIARWGSGGERRWEQALWPTGLTSISNVATNGLEPVPSVVLQFDDADGSWVCSIAGDGTALMKSERLTRWWGSLERAWWGDDGLVLFTELVGTGTSNRLIGIDPTGSVTNDIQVGAAGDVLGFPSSSIADVMTNADGDLVLAGSRSDYIDGTEPSPSNLDRWSFVLRLSATPNDGGLASLPLERD